MAQWTPQQLQQMAALLQGTHNTLAVDAAVANAPAQRWAVDANGQRVDPYSSNPALAAIEGARPSPTSVASPVQAYAPGGMPSQAPRPDSRATGQMRANPLFGTPAGMLMSLFGGKPQNRSLMAKPVTSAQRYAAASGGPGSVSAMELWHGGGSRNPQSGGPAAGGDYGGR